MGEISTSIVTHMLEDSHVGGTRGSCFKSEHKVRIYFSSGGDLANVLLLMYSSAPETKIYPEGNNASITY